MTVQTLGPAPPRGFTEALGVCLPRYWQFSGRASRSEYWWFFLWTLLPPLLVGPLGDVGGSLAAIVQLVLVVPALSVFCRRMHDTGRSGWWWLVGLVPVLGPIVLLVLLCQPGQRRANRYG